MELLGEPDIDGVIKATGDRWGRLRWSGHILSKNADKIPPKNYKSLPEGKTAHRETKSKV